LWIFVGCAAAITSLGLIVFLPSYGITQISGYHEWRGITSHKNALGLSMVYLLTPVFFIRVRPWFRVVYSCALIFLAVMSKSREAWFMVGAVLFFVVWFDLFRRLRDKERMLLVLITSVLLITALTVVMINFDSLMIGIGKDPSMTGRTGIYAAVADSIAKRPLAGYGYNAFWAPVNRESLVVQMTVHWLSLGYAENGILEAALQVGCIGVFLAFLMFAQGIRQGMRLIRSGFYNPRVGWFMCLLYLEALTNIESGWILTPGNLSWIMTIIACVGLADEMSHVRAAQLALSPQAASLQPMPARS
jgi:exopolysaccharide production protein ExoQ